MKTRRQVMNAFGKYLDFARHLQSIKEGEARGDIGNYARETVALHYEYNLAIREYVGCEEDDDDDEP
ncbi:MAG: hypothetical protein JKY49_00375 [Cohaesibacteraceae bacterium]|nr:hypothetical protein [Cohaesibacteraceae bacterium]MBL4875753.1 hypothetical protein [Cohaesibacteraceae bacterium]